MLSSATKTLWSAFICVSCITCLWGQGLHQRSPVGSGWPRCDLRRPPHAELSFRHSPQLSHPLPKGSTWKRKTTESFHEYILVQRSMLVNRILEWLMYLWNMKIWAYLLRACTSPLKAANRTFMIWYPCRGAEMCWYWLREHWTEKNQPLIQPSTVYRPESAGTASWCQNCAVETSISAPMIARIIIREVCLRSWSLESYLAEVNSPPRVPTGI